eukprot:TRINITY_DN279_c0_g10_i1.p1 TRINITY_DN279_c0_g10~~TRINITY_DN279_c0_g10_i1.p1  ORF type:complete len:316 (-),score=27.92 TRINITY_DN279_c0_g10_i1:292-1239(-)
MANKFKKEEVYSGMFAGMLGTGVGHPFDLIKVRLQTHSYVSAFDCAKKTFQFEGIRGFYKGITPPLVSLTFLNTVSFSTYGWTKRFLSEFNANPANDYNVTNLHSYQYFLGGAFTGFILSSVSTPFDFVKVQTQLHKLDHESLSKQDEKERQAFKKKPIGSLQCTYRLIQTYGASIIMKGYTINAVRETVFNSIYFGFYEHIKKFLVAHFASHSLLATPAAVAIAGSCSGVSGWFISFPLDVVKSIIQSSRALPQVPKINDAFRDRWKEQGFRGFYRGVSVSLYRAVLVSAIRFSGFELALNLLSSKKSKKRNQR